MVQAADRLVNLRMLPLTVVLNLAVMFVYVFCTLLNVCYVYLAPVPCAREVDDVDNDENMVNRTWCCFLLVASSAS